MKKTMRVLALLVGVMLLFVQNAFAVSVVMNSLAVTFPNQQPVIVNERVLVPIRPIAERLELDVAWDNVSKTATLSKGNYYVKITIGKTDVETSNGIVKLNQGAEIINDYTMVPIRFIAETFDLNVIWVGKYQSVIINGSISTSKKSGEVGKEVGYDPSNPSDASDATSPTGAAVYSTKQHTNTSEGEAVEENEGAEEDLLATTINATVGASNLTITVPTAYTPEDDMQNEGAFAYRAVDATDIQHLYNWDVVSLYQGYADSQLTSGIFVIVQDFGEPSESETLTDEDLSNIESAVATFTDPEPERPEISYRDVQDGLGELAAAEIEKLKTANPDLSDEEIYQMLNENPPDYSSVAGYDDWMAYRETHTEWSNAYYEHSRRRTRLYRNWSAVSDKLSNDAWAQFFSEMLNTDAEVAYTNVTVEDKGTKKIVHMLIEAKDSDDEQGTFDCYMYFDGNSRATIYGGTLNASEAAPETVEALSSITIQ